jgi:hypothetical protein
MILIAMNVGGLAVALPSLGARPGLCVPEPAPPPAAAKPTHEAPPRGVAPVPPVWMVLGPVARFFSPFAVCAAAPRHAQLD